MKIVRNVKTEKDAMDLLTAALEHEWAVSFEYVVHAYSMPKAQFFYRDPVMKIDADARAQTIQIGIDEMYHAMQLGIVLFGMGIEPSFKTDEIIRFPKIIDNLKRDKKTEDLVTDMYQSAGLEPGRFPKIENMIWNISYDEVRHGLQFAAMIKAMEDAGQSGAECFKPSPERGDREDLALFHKICGLENELMHRYLFHVMIFSGHQDLSQRLYKNSINHMRHWDKMSGILVKMGDVVAIENAVTDAAGVETSKQPMPSIYPGRDRISALASLLPVEEDLVSKYERAVALARTDEVRDQLRLHLALTREHVFTQAKLLENARRIKGLI